MKKALKIVAGAAAGYCLWNAGCILGVAAPIAIALMEGRDDDAEILKRQYDKAFAQIDGDFADAIGICAVGMANLRLRLEKKNEKFVYVKR